MHQQRDREKLNIIDEGWMALENLATVRYLQDAWRLGRQFDTGNILITHAINDLHSQSDDGSALSKIEDNATSDANSAASFGAKPSAVT